VRDRARADDAARTGRRDVDRRLARDLGDGGARLEDGARVRVEVEVALGALGVAPRDHEDLLALVEQVLDEAAPRREVEDVELVDRRGYDEQRHLAHALGAGLVLDQLEDLGAQDHRSLRDREVLADREPARVDAGRQPWRAREVAHELTHPARQAGPAMVDDILEHGRVRPGEVRRCQRVEDVGRREARPALGAPVGLRVGDQAVDRAAGRQVGLQDAPQEPVGLPCRVGEAPVALARAQLAPPRRDAREVAAEPGEPPSHAIGSARQARPDARGRARADDASPRRRRCRVGEQDVERGTGAGGHAHACAPATGAWISRLRIFPVGPLGSASTNHTWRGYL
jgi:hypothetical protein